MAEALVSRKDGQPCFPNLKSDRICSDHFLPEDSNKETHHLKKTSGSSVFPKECRNLILRIQKPFLDSEVMMLVEEYLQLCEILKNLKKLAGINVDLLYLGMDVKKVPEIEEEVDKVQELIQTLMNGTEACGIEIFCVENNVKEGDTESLDKQENILGREDVDPIKGYDSEYSGDDDDDYHMDNEDMLPFNGDNKVCDKLRIETLEKKGTKSQQPTKVIYVPKPHTCLHCDKKFTSKIELTNHLKKDHKNEVYKCKICSKEFKRYRDLCRHQRHHDRGDIGVVLCSICGQQCMNRQTLLLHLKHHEELENGPYKCTVCCKDVRSKIGLKIHMKTHIKPKKEQGDCPICGKQISDRNLKRHIQSHSEVKPYKCSICHKTFTQSTSQILHMRTHTRDYPHRCSYCNKGFNSPSSLRAHENRHRGIKTYKCHKCGKVFESQTLVNSHKEQNDSCHGSSFSVVSGKPFKCSVCPRQLVTSITFALHMLSHCESRELDHCLLCNDGKSFTSFLDFQSHLKSVHLSEKPFQCSICEESFLTIHHLHSHKAMHADALTCKECGKSFKSPMGLRHHLIIKHSTEPLIFMCDICGKQLSSPACLTKHRKIHSGLKPCMCQICGCGLSSRSALKLHLWTHTKEKRFQCEKCDKGFNDKRNYESHLKKWHAEDAAILS